MQSAPRFARVAVRHVARTPAASTSTASPYAATSLYSLHSTASQPVSLRFPTSNVRALSSTPRVEAKEPESDPFASEKFASEHAPLFQRIQQHPEVLDAIENMARVTRDKTGVDLAAGQKPSMMMMLQLARDPDLRAASERLMAALRAAGVEFNPAEAFQALQQMGGEGFEKMAEKGLKAYHDEVRKGGEGDGEGNEGSKK
ncbi:hypothetical protein BMF94_4705 [Rhodotorula taiwanensis]|uniref:Uncharacterized protein n=1 Tax=Rhodotorula taiwanensis TaxID=741276 RepID=A0A2S5B654_9BASI|nr:hypothetical protein BMF94_4705 [Rhodotorula taiwanensis]